MSCLRRTGYGAIGSEGRIRKLALVAEKDLTLSARPGKVLGPRGVLHGH